MLETKFQKMKKIIRLTRKEVLGLANRLLKTKGYTGNPVSVTDVQHVLQEGELVFSSDSNTKKHIQKRMPKKLYFSKLFYSRLGKLDIQLSLNLHYLAIDFLHDASQRVFESERGINQEQKRLLIHMYGLDKPEAKTQMSTFKALQKKGIDATHNTLKQAKADFIHALTLILAVRITEFGFRLKEVVPRKDFLKKSVKEVGLPELLSNVLIRAKVRTVGQLFRLGRNERLYMKGLTAGNWDQIMYFKQFIDGKI